MRKFLEKFDFANILMFVVCAVVGMVDGGGALMAAAVNVPSDGETRKQGLDTNVVNGTNPDLLMETINEEIVKIRPTFTPLDTILRSAKSRKAEGWEYAWYFTDLSPVSTIAESITANATANDVGYYDAQLTVTNASMINPSDTIFIDCPAEITEGTTTKTIDRVVLLVIAKDPATGVLTVTFGGGDVPVTDINTAITASLDSESNPTLGVYCMGRAAAEGEVQTFNYASLPMKESNYCQIFKWQVAQSTLEKMHKKEVKWDMSDLEEEAVCKFKMCQESTFLFSRKVKYFDNVKKAEIYSTGGLVDYISKHAQFSQSGGVASLIDMTQTIFQGNTGNRKRVMFMGSDFNAALSKIDIEKTLASRETETVWGIEFSTIRTNFGALSCIQHDLLDLYGFKDKAIVLDVDNIDKYVWTAETRDLNLRDAGVFDGDAKVYTEIAGAALRYPDTHCIVTLVP